MSAMSYHSGYTVPRLRITRRGRVVVAIMIALLLAVTAAAFGVGAFGAAAGTQSGSATFQYVSVEPGESLWQLAVSIAPHADPRDVVAEIVDLNNLSTAEVQPGQRLAIPSKYNS
ncbi:LysM peptidoglycan-binding domain-containing protein [Lysinimonas soli]|uniref:LysM peptidoglycan-binding domain-containing protein n=1 Tax=Lysinimonas soli TaxID=1074233 RepID=A0ABW0NN34_9MICO